MKIQIKQWLYILIFLPMTITGQTDRELWVNELTKFSKPLLTAISKDQLKEKMPIDQSQLLNPQEKLHHIITIGCSFLLQLKPS